MRLKQLNRNEKNSSVWRLKYYRFGEGFYRK